MNKEEHKKIRFAHSAPYLLAFFLPVLLWLAVMIERKVAPFGDQCFTIRDLYHQYAPFFKEFRNKLVNGGSLFYDWNIGGGTSFLPLFAYYLASPLNVFLLFCPENLVIECMTGLIVIKSGLSSLTMTLYLNRHNGKSGAAAYPAALFGVLYALSGYMAAYFWNIMWLDCIWLFPVVILGLERLVCENKGLLYSFALGLAILTNYYIAAIMCFGVAVYCFLFLGIGGKIYDRFGVKLVKFFLYTLLAVALSAVLLLPYIRYYSMTASANGTFRWENSFYSYFSLFDVVSRHLLNVQMHMGLDHWPNVYCGVAVLLLLPFYFLNGKIPLREKLGYALVLLFYCFSFSTRFMDYLWHVFHLPNSLPCRQSFLYIFVLLTVCFRGLLLAEDLSYREVTLSMLAGLVFVFAAEKLQTDKTYYGFSVFYPSALLIVLYTLLVYAKKSGRINRTLLLVCSFALVCAETFINTTQTGLSTYPRAVYTEYDADVKAIEEVIRREDRDRFFRTEKDRQLTKNEGAWLGYRSVSTFSSTANANLTDFYKTIGLLSSVNSYGSSGRTFFTDMLMDVKYTISKGSLYESEHTRSLYEQSNDIRYYRNRYVLPLGYVLDPGALARWDHEGETPLVYQNKLAYEVSGVQDLFLDVTPEYTAAPGIALMAPEAGYYYAYSDVSGPKKLKVIHKDSQRTYSDMEKGYTIDLGWCEEGEAIAFINDDQQDSKRKDVNVSLYLFRQDLMPLVYDAFAESAMTVTSFADTEITAEVDAHRDGTLFTTIPCEEGWTVTVDGVPAACGKALSAYLTVDLSEGRHELCFRFETPLFRPAAGISIASAAIMLAIFVVEKKRSRRLRIANGDTGESQ